MKKLLNRWLTTIMTVILTVSFAACSNDGEPDDKGYDYNLWGEWIEMDGKSYVHGYMYFASDGTGIRGSWESDIDWVNENDEFNWYTVNNQYLYLNKRKYKYDWDGDRHLTIYNYNGKNRVFYIK